MIPIQGEGIIDQNGMRIYTKSFSVAIGIFKIPTNCIKKYEWKFEIEAAPQNEYDALMKIGLHHRKAGQNFCFMSNGTRIREYTKIGGAAIHCRYNIEWGKKDKHLVLIYKKKLHYGVKIRIIDCFYVYLLNVV